MVTLFTLWTLLSAFAVWEIYTAPRIEDCNEDLGDW